MTQEDKQLLIKDLCARLPYGVIIRRSYTNSYVDFKLHKISDERINDLEKIEECKPYLRPMSSMTDEEEARYNLIQGIGHWTADDGKLSDYADAIDWLNEHHFDYHGLIEKGLALEAHEGMYKKD